MTPEHLLNRHTRPAFPQYQDFTYLQVAEPQAPGDTHELEATPRVYAGYVCHVVATQANGFGSLESVTLRGWVPNELVPVELAAGRFVEVLA